MKKVIFCLTLLVACGKKETTTEVTYVEQPKYTCIKYYKKPRRKRIRKCKIVYVADNTTTRCKCKG